MLLYICMYICTYVTIHMYVHTYVCYYTYVCTYIGVHIIIILTHAMSRVRGRGQPYETDILKMIMDRVTPFCVSMS